MNLLLGIAAWGVQTALTARRRGEVRGEEEQARRGLLLPGNLEAPNFQGTVFPDSAMKIFYGKKCAGWTEGDTFVALRHSGNEDLLLTRTDDGIAIQTRFFDRSGKLIGKMDGNEFTFTSEDDLLTVHRPEDHVLVVKDRANVEVLYVAYLNPTTIQIRTDFYMSNGSRLNVKDDEIFVVTPAGGRIHFHDQGFSPNGVLKINLDGSIGIGPAAPLISPPAP